MDFVAGFGTAEAVRLRGQSGVELRLGVPLQRNPRSGPPRRCVRDAKSAPRSKNRKIKAAEFLKAETLRYLLQKSEKQIPRPRLQTAEAASG